MVEYMHVNIPLVAGLGEALRTQSCLESQYLMVHVAIDVE